MDVVGAGIVLADMHAAAFLAQSGRLEDCCCREQSAAQLQIVHPLLIVAAVFACKAGARKYAAKRCDLVCRLLERRAVPQDHKAGLRCVMQLLAKLDGTGAALCAEGEEQLLLHPGKQGRLCGMQCSLFRIGSGALARDVALEAFR